MDDEPELPRAVLRCQKCREYHPSTRHDHGSGYVLCNACWFVTMPRVWPWSTGGQEP